jgi:hypothetical protein
MTEATSTSETSVNFYKTTQRNIPEDSHLHYPIITKRCRKVIVSTWCYVVPSGKNKVNWEGYGKKWLWPILRYYLNFAGGNNKTT